MSVKFNKWNILFMLLGNLVLALGEQVHVGTVASVLLMGPVADFVNQKFVRKVIIVEKTEPVYSVNEIIPETGIRK